jgi:hypothetical protein
VDGQKDWKGTCNDFLSQARKYDVLSFYFRPGSGLSESFPSVQGIPGKNVGLFDAVQDEVS